MTPGWWLHRKVYLNPNLLYFYSEALHSLRIAEPVRMSKRVSAIGDLLRFRLELPLDERSTGYQSVDIETIDQLTVITLKKTEEITVIAFPDTEKLKQASFEQSVCEGGVRRASHGRASSEGSRRLLSRTVRVPA